MPQHEVKQGECLTRIARLYGFGDPRAVWNHADNAGLRAKRPNPNVLFPGDSIRIPDPKLKTIPAAPAQKHRFVLGLPRKALRLVLRGHDGEPLADEPYELEVDRKTRSGTTDGDGMLHEKLPLATPHVKLIIAGRVLELRLGHLNPIGDLDENDASGVQGRLHNLGYDVGPRDGLIGRRTRAALAVFQADHDLTVDGVPGGETLARLVSEHGC